jgi:ABC-2 type transport system permease protein
MRKYIAIAKATIIAEIIYRAHFIFTLIGNIIVLTLIYFLWKSIYNDRQIINGMTFNDTFVYLALASTIFTLFLSYVDWEISLSVIDGSIIMNLIKPLDYQLNMLVSKTGHLMFNFLIICIPSLLFLFFVFRVNIHLGWNILFFSVSFFFSFMISFNFEYIVGLMAFYTKSNWGLITIKNMIIMVLSGAVIPLNFFPENLRNIVSLLPFKAMYDIPLRKIVLPPENFKDYFYAYAFQIVWLVIIFIVSRLFYRKAIKVLTVSGG